MLDCEGFTMKPVKAWAIVHSGNRIDIFDERVSVYWLKHIAHKEMKEKSFSDSRVVKVEIREIDKRKGKAS